MGCCSNGATLTCCPEKQYVQDKVCTPWSGTGDDTDPVIVTLFTNNVSYNIYGTGYVQYDVGPDPITLSVLDGLGTVLYTTTLPAGTSLSFTFRRFATIQLTLPQPWVPIRGSSASRPDMLCDGSQRRTGLLEGSNCPVRMRPLPRAPVVRQQGGLCDHRQHAAHDPVILSDSMGRLQSIQAP